MKTFRRSLATALLLIYVTMRLLLLIPVRSDPALFDALALYAGRALPETVCYPVTPAEDEIGYYATLYAVIPSVLMLPGAGCAGQVERLPVIDHFRP